MKDMMGIDCMISWVDGSNEEWVKQKRIFWILYRVAVSRIGRIQVLVS